MGQIPRSIERISSFRKYVTAVQQW